MLKKYFILPLFLLFSPLTHAADFSYEDGGTRFSVRHRADLLEYSSGRERISILKDSCSAPYIDTFWEKIEKKFQASSDVSSKKVLAQIVLNDNVKRLSVRAESKGYFLGIKKDVIILRREVGRSCKRKMASEETHSNQRGLHAKESSGAPSLVRQCVEKICPDSTVTVSHAYDLVDGYDLEKDHFYNEKIKKLINKEGVNLSKVDIRAAGLLRKWLKGGGKIINKRQSRALNFLYHLKDYSKFVFKHGEAKEVDDIQSRKKFPGISNEDYQAKKNVVYAAQKAFSNPDFNFLALSTTDPASLRIYVPERGIKPLFKKILFNIKKYTNTIKNTPGFQSLFKVKSYRDSTDTSLLEKIIRTGEFSAGDLHRVNVDFGNLATVAYLAEDRPELKALEVPFDISKIAKENNLDKYLKSSIAKEKKMFKNQFSKGSYRSGACEAAYATSKVVLPSKAQLSAWSKKKHGLLNNLIKGLEAYLSAKSIQVLKRKRKGRWYLVPPPSGEKNIKDLVQALEKEHRRNKSYRHELDNLAASKDRDFWYSLMAFGSLFEKEESESEGSDAVYGAAPNKEYLSGVEEICRKFISELVPDKTVTATGGVVVGPLTVTKQPLGDGTAYHEFGHNLSNFLQSGKASRKSKFWYNETMACMRSMHNSGDSRFQEEDFSDIMQTIAAPDIGNSECMLSRGLSDNRDYAYHSLDHGKKRGVHSNPLFRVLHIEYLLKGRLPKVCNEALRSKNEKPFFKNCKVERPHLGP